MDTAIRVVLYGRTSLDTSEGRSVDDQLNSLRAWANRTGRTVVAELRDDGRSASRYARQKKPRPDWQRAMELISAGMTDELAVWEISRSTRDRAVWAALIAACIEQHVSIAVDGKVHDPADPDDAFMLDLGAALAVRESGVTSKRNQRGVDGRAAAGRPHGSIPYGYRRVLDPLTGKPVARQLHPGQAPVVEEIARRLLAREPANAIAADLNGRGIRTQTGRQWRPANLTTMILRPTYAGLRVYRGRVLDDVTATWPAILTEEEHYRLVAMHADPARDKFRNPTHAKHLGTGIYRCGREGCGGPMRVVVEAGKPNRYDCRICHKVSRHQQPVDEAIELAMVDYLAQPKIQQLLAERDKDDTVSLAAAEVARLKLKLRAARDAWEQDRLSLEAYQDMEARTLPAIRAAEDRARPRSVPAVVFDVAGPDAERKWKALPVTDKRLLVATFLDVKILPAGRGKWKFDPDDIAASWRGAV